MNHTLAYAPKSEALIRKTNAFQTYAADRVIIKFNIENTTIYAVAKKGEKLEEVFQREIESRGGVVEKKYYKEFNASQIEKIKIGNLLLEGNIHFFMKDLIPMVSNGNGIEFPNASEITIDGNATEFSFRRVNFQVNPTTIEQMSNLYQGGVEISPGAQEIMKGQQNREKIACAHGETRNYAIEANSDNMVAIDPKTGEIMSVAEINSEKRVQPIREEKIVLQPVTQIAQTINTQERFGDLDLVSLAQIQNYQNITNLSKDANNERRQIEERATTIEFGGLKVANDNAEYRVEIVRETGLDRIKIVREPQYKAEKQEEIIPNPRVLDKYELACTKIETGKGPKKEDLEIPKEKTVQKIKNIAHKQEMLHKEELDKSETLRIDGERTTPKEREQIRAKQVLIKFNYTSKAPEVETKPKEKKGKRKIHNLEKINTPKKEEKVNKQKERESTKNKINEIDKVKIIKAKKIRKNEEKKEITEIKAEKMKKQKIRVSKIEKIKVKLTEKETSKDKIKKNNDQKSPVNQVLGEKIKQKPITQERKETQKTKQRIQENKGKLDKKRKIKKYFFNELLGLFKIKKKKVNKLKRN
jgi:hypothetical protein